MKAPARRELGVAPIELADADDMLCHVYSLERMSEHWEHIHLVQPEPSGYDEDSVYDDILEAAGLFVLFLDMRFGKRYGVTENSSSSDAHKQASAEAQVEMDAQVPDQHRRASAAVQFEADAQVMDQMKSEEVQTRVNVQEQ